MQGLKEVLPTVVQDALQDLIEAEVAARLGAAWWERFGQHSGTRNGSRPRTVSTSAGDVEVRIPTLCNGSICPDLSAAPPGRPGTVGCDHDRVRDGHVDAEGR